MSTSARTGHRGGRGGRRAAGVLLAAAVGMGGLAACGDSAGPEAGVTTEDLQRIQDDLGALDERVGVLEEGTAAGIAEPGIEDPSGVFEDADSLIGQEVTVSAEVTEVMTSSDVGSAFRIGGDGGEAIEVLAATPPEQLQVDDVVRISGTVVTIQQDSFEQDFGVAADELFDDASGFFADFEGEVAISADRVQVLEDPADG